MQPYGLITQVKFDKTKSKKAKGTETRNIIKSLKTSERSFVKLQIERDVIEHYNLDITRNNFKNSVTNKATKRAKAKKRCKEYSFKRYMKEVRKRMVQHEEKLKTA